MNDFRVTVLGLQGSIDKDLLYYWMNPMSLIIPAVVLAGVIIAVSHLWKRK